MLTKIKNKYNNLPVQVKASFWFLICSFLQKGISAITTPILTRLLTTSEYGQYSVFNSWLTILTVFVTLNLYSGVFTSGMVKFEERKAQFASAMQGLCITLVAGWTVVYWLARDYWNTLFSLTTVQMLCMLIIMWATAAYNFWAVEQRVDFKYKSLVILTLIVSAAKPLIGIVFIILATDKVTALILGFTLVLLIGHTGLFFVQMKRGKVFFSVSIWKYALSFNIPLIPHYLSMNVMGSADRIMISNMVGTEAAGIYNLAHSVALIMTMFNRALLQTLEPWLYKKIKGNQIRDIPRVAYFTFILIALVNIALIVFAPEIVAIFAPKAYYDAIWVIPSVTMSVYFMFAYTFFAVFEFYFKKTKFILIATVLGAIFNISLNYFLIPRFGYYVAGYNALLSYILYTVMHYSMMRYICSNYMNGVDPYSLRILLIITASFMFVGFASLLSYNNVFLRFVLICILLIAFVVKYKKVKEIIKKLINIREENKKSH